MTLNLRTDTAVFSDVALTGNEPVPTLACAYYDFANGIYARQTGGVLTWQDFAAACTWGATSEIGKAYVGPAGLITKTTATNEPRIEHDPVTLRPLGLRVEQSSTNVLLNSGTLTSMSPSGLTVAAVTSPKVTDAGGMYSLTETATSGVHTLAGTGSLTAAIHTVSAHVQAGSAYIVQMGFAAAAVAQGWANFDLRTGTVTAKGADVINATIKRGPGGTWRISVTASVAVVTSSPISYVGLVANDSAAARQPTYTGSTAQLLYAGALQVEAKPGPTSYIGTTSGAVTRSADSIDSANADLIDLAQGAAFVDGLYADNSFSAAGLGYATNTYNDGECLVGMDNASGNAARYVAVRSSTQALAVTSRTAAGASAALDMRGESFLPGRRVRALGSWGGGRFSTVGRGGIAAATMADAELTVPNVRIGRGRSFISGNRHWNGIISRVVFYPRELSAAEAMAEFDRLR